MRICVEEREHGVDKKRTMSHIIYGYDGIVVITTDNAEQRLYVVNVKKKEEGEEKRR